jgi:hypothetical protein
VSERTIHRFQLNLGRNVIPVHVSGKVLKAAAVKPGEDTVSVWALVDADPMASEGTSMLRRFLVTGTGHAIDSDYVLEHVGTAVTANGLVWHVFEERTR